MRKLQSNTAHSVIKKKLGEGFFDEENFDAYNIKVDFSIPGALKVNPRLMSDLATGTNTGNCAPTAAFNLVCYLKEGRGLSNVFIDNDEEKTYAELVSKMGFNENGVDGVNYDMLQSGLKSYLEDRGYKVKIGDYLYDWWSDFKRDFDGGYPNLMLLQGNDYKDDKWIIIGHFVVGVGYLIMNDNSRYIRVYDGWFESTKRFIGFDHKGFTSIKGAVVDVSKK